MSDLLIRNFDLPTYGYREIRIYPNGDITEVDECGLDDVVGTAEYLPPHGRLGDLDALAQQIEHERLLSESAAIINNLIQEVEQYRSQQTIADDSYRPLWPNWDY